MSRLPTSAAALENSDTFLPWLDGIRTIAVGFVVAAHYRFIEGFGAFGVTIFFFLSGFLISRLLFAESNASGGSIRLGAFYGRRLLRLYPALVLFIGVYSLTLALYLKSPPQWIEVWGGLFYFHNYLNLWREVHQPTVEASWGILWSLAVEEHFYLFFPAIFARFHGDRARFYRLVLAACLAVLVWRHLARTLGIVDWRWTYQATDSRIDSILWGVALSASLEVRILRERLQRLVARPMVVSAIALLILALSLRLGPRHQVVYSMQGVGLWLCFAVACFSTGRAPDLLRLLLSSRPMAYLGKISYGIYLWHGGCYLVLARILQEFDIGLSAPLLGAAASILTLGVTSASYELVERRFLTLRHKFPPAHRVAVARS